MSETDKILPGDGALAAEYALGVLPHRERELFTKRLESSAGLRAELLVWDKHFLPLASEYKPTIPPISVLNKIEDRLFGSAAAPTPWWRNLSLWRGTAFASIAAALLLGGLYFTQFYGQDGSDITYIAEIKSEDGGLRLAAAYDAAQGNLRINKIAGTPASGRDFELWLIVGEAAPVSLGVLPASENFTIPLAEDMVAQLGDKALFAISDEPTGGSPTGQPTGAVLATGTIAQI